MLIYRRTITCLSVWTCFFCQSWAQTTGIQTGAGPLTWAPGQIYTISTAVPFLRINPDARSGGMGDVGIATTPDVNSIYVNPAKLAFVDGDGGFSAGFVPWLRTLVNGIFLADLNGYYKIKKKQTIAISARYFSYGILDIPYNGASYLQYRPSEFAIDAHYARQLSDYFSISGSVRFIYSNLPAAASVNGIIVKPGMAGAGDIGWYFHRTYHQNDEHKLQHTFSCGMAITNMGNKMSYTSIGEKDYLPTNLGIGFGYKLDIDRYNSIGVYLDLNKLLVPAPFGGYDSTHQTYYYREESPVKGMFTSFGDAPAKQELQYITESVGLEYFFNNLYGARMGYFYEALSAGGRQFVTIGVTARYRFASFHFSYLIPTDKSLLSANPLYNTMQFTLVFDFMQKAESKSGKSAKSSA